MNIELKPFQEKAVTDLLKAVVRAREEIAEGLPQAIAFSSPTGSGKTIAVTALMEKIIEGDETVEGADADNRATFLWFSNDPELNRQSRDKILRMSSRFQDSDLILVDNSFHEEVLSPGKVYFLNTQKLSRTSGLTSKGDERKKTIWEVIDDTEKYNCGHFVLIIDEAHRGMTADAVRDANEAVTIVQKFIKGSDEVCRLKFILGMSATPERFEQFISTTGRTKRPVVIEPALVIDSGLLKDRIVISHATENRSDEFALLEAAVNKWKSFAGSWQQYCASQTLSTVRPILVVQVEDATANAATPTRTDLAKVIEVIERALGRSLEEKEVAHSFQEDKAISVGDKLRIRKLDASTIQDDPEVSVVFFKMSLTTGWDCPRAEVMMSFRAAADHTLIAQLVGRMVRTPLARRVEAKDYDALNAVSLYLPKYDEDELEKVVKSLQDPESQTAIAVDIESELEMLTLDGAKSELKKIAESLPSYTVESIRKTTGIRRLMKLCRGLAYHGIDTDASQNARQFVVDHLIKNLQAVKDDPGFVAQTAQTGEIEVCEVVIENGTFKRSSSKPIKLKASPENLDRLFRLCGGLLGDGLHLAYWKAKTDASLNEPLKAKIELFALLHIEGVLPSLEAVCVKEFDRIKKTYKHQINKLTSSERLFYATIAPDPKVASDCAYPGSLPMRGKPPEGREFKHKPFEAEGHLYVNTQGKAWVYPQSGWETDIVRKFTTKKGTVGWMRNLPKKSWSLAIPYDKGGAYGPIFPDYIVFVKRDGQILPSIVDPHNEAYEDSEKRAIGIAHYADKHGNLYHEILLITKEGDNYRALDLNRTDVRQKVYKANSRADLADIRKELGFNY
jgi:type III restriction enzyme